LRGDAEEGAAVAQVRVGAAILRDAVKIAVVAFGKADGRGGVDGVVAVGEVVDGDECAVGIDFEDGA
jgi:hypothetical protein